MIGDSNRSDIALKSYPLMVAGVMEVSWSNHNKRLYCVVLIIFSKKYFESLAQKSNSLTLR